MKLNSIALISILTATVLATPIPDAAPGSYGKYPNYGKYGNYGSYPPPHARAESPEKRATPGADLPSYGSYGDYGTYPGGLRTTLTQSKS
jgi:hypothetical protein